MTMNTYAHFLNAEDITVAEAMDGILKPKIKRYNFPVSIKRHGYVRHKFILIGILYKFIYYNTQ